jgi:hypothetical protein
VIFSGTIRRHTARSGTKRYLPLASRQLLAHHLHLSRVRTHFSPALSRRGSQHQRCVANLVCYYFAQACAQANVYCPCPWGGHAGCDARGRVCTKRRCVGRSGLPLREILSCEVNALARGTFRARPRGWAAPQQLHSSTVVLWGVSVDGVLIWGHAPAALYLESSVGNAHHAVLHLPACKEPLWCDSCAECRSWAWECATVQKELQQWCSGANVNPEQMVLCRRGDVCAAAAEAARAIKAPRIASVGTPSTA